MKSKITSQATLVFVMGGIAKSGKAYLQASNGLNSFFLNISEKIDKQAFETWTSSLGKGDEFKTQISLIPGETNVDLVSLPTKA